MGEISEMILEGVLCEMSTKCRTCDKVCAYRTEDHVPEYAAIIARVTRLEEALREIRDYDSYKHPDESLIVLRDAAIKESNECTACQYAKTAKWQPSGLCDEHYRTVTRAEDKVKQMFEYKQTWEPREIARRALEEK